MPKRSNKRESADQAAGRIVGQVIGESISKTDAVKATTDEGKALRNRAASILGKLGGSKEGSAEARNLTPEKRRQIAQNAAVAKWKAKAD